MICYRSENMIKAVSTALMLVLVSQTAAPCFANENSANDRREQLLFLKNQAHAALQLNEMYSQHLNSMGYITHFFRGKDSTWNQIGIPTKVLLVGIAGGLAYLTFTGISDNVAEIKLLRKVRGAPSTQYSLLKEPIAKETGVFQNKIFQEVSQKINLEVEAYQSTLATPVATEVAEEAVLKLNPALEEALLAAVNEALTSVMVNLALYPLTFGAGFALGAIMGFDLRPQDLILQKAPQAYFQPQIVPYVIRHDDPPKEYFKKAFLADVVKNPTQHPQFKQDYDQGVRLLARFTAEDPDYGRRLQKAALSAYRHYFEAQEQKLKNNLILQEQNR